MGAPALHTVVPRCLLTGRHDMRATVRTLLASALLSASVLPAAAADAPVADAAQHQDWTKVTALVAGRADVNGRQPDGATALAWAAHWNNVDAAEALVKAGADANAANDLGIAPLALAAKNGSLPMVALLLTAGADPNAKSTGGETPLMTAAITGSAGVVKTLVAHGADVNAATVRSKQTAVMWAVSERHPSVVQALVEAGADLEARTAGGFTALLFAARQGDAGSTRVLLDGGAKIDAAGRDMNTPLVVAAASAREDVALLLLERGANPNADAAGYTPLHAAVPRNLPRLVKALLAGGAHPDARLKNAPGFLFGSNRGAGSEVVPVSADELQAGVAGTVGARPTAGSLAGATPFWLAAKNVNVPIMEALIAAGADPTLTTDNGTTPLMAAAGLLQVQGSRTRRADVSQFYSNWNEADSLDAVTFLLARGADAKAVNKSAQTALHGAAYMGANSVVQVLIDRGAAIDARDAQGQTPFRIAEGHLNVAGQGVTEWPKTAAFLRTLGADTSLGVDGRSMLRIYPKSDEPLKSR
jgi:ankyrin repeat protein